MRLLINPTSSQGCPRQFISLSVTPAWEMTDGEAYMELALGNVQGEFSPLEQGIHVFGLKHRRGVEGGLSGYAREVGKTPKTISANRMAAEVLLDIKSYVDVRLYVNKAEHLTCIHRAAKKLWLMLAQAIIKYKWTAADTDYWIDKVREFDIPSKWQMWFLLCIMWSEDF